MLDLEVAVSSTFCLALILHVLYSQMVQEQVEGTLWHHVQKGLVSSSPVGLSRVAPWQRDLDTGGNITAHYPACQEPSTATVWPEEL